MAFTGRLGTDESQPGNIQPGADGSWSDDSAYQADAFQNDAFQTVAVDPLDQVIFDTVSTSATPVRVVETSRTATDTVTTSESATRIVNRPGAATDAITTSDVATWSGTFNRAATDDLGTQEGAGDDTFQGDTFQDDTFQIGFATRQLVGSRDVTDAPTTSEDADFEKVTTRFATDDPSVAESVERTGAFLRETTDSISATDAAVFDLPVTAIEASFGVDAFVVGGTSMHSRPDDHFGTQDDTTIILAEDFGSYPAGTTLAVVLAGLYGGIEGLSDIPNARFGVSAFIHPYFNLNAVIEATAAPTFGIDARISGGATRTINAIIKGAKLTTLVPFDAYLVGSSHGVFESFSINSVLKKTIPKTFTGSVNAVIASRTTFVVGAVLKKTVQGLNKSINAVIASRGFTIAAWIES